MPSTAWVALLLFCLFLLVFLPKMSHVCALRERSENLGNELEGLKKKNDALREELYLLEKDPFYLEKVARDKFNKVKQGEIVYKVVRPAKPAKSS